jgi:hypothetical protein
MNLKISSTLNLPLDVVTQTFAVLAIRRSGKTYTASVLAEEMMKAKLPFVVLDPTGAWWGLRASADGKREGYPVVIIGGAHGDVPLEPTAGKVLADLVVDHPGWYVIDMSQTVSNAEQDRIAQDFAEHLYRRKAKSTFPLHLFVDEADSFAPQQAMPNQKRMLGAFEALVRRGGIRGIGTTLITQRPAVLNKNVLTQTDNLIVLRVTSPQDRAAIDDWVKGNGTKEERDTMMSSLASLQQGEAWFWAPVPLGIFQKIQIRQRETFNSSATPKHGEHRIEPRKLATVDLNALRDKISATIEKAKADDPKLLRQRIAELEREVKQHAAAVVAVPDMQAIKEALEENNQEWEERLLFIQQRNEDLIQRLYSIREKVNDLTEPDDLIGVGAKPKPPKKTAPAKIPIQQEAHKPSRPGLVIQTERKASSPFQRALKRTTERGAGELAGVSASEQRILDGLAWWEGLGINTPIRPQVAFVADYTVSGHFNNLLGSLRMKGLLEYPQGNCVSLTAEGRAMARMPENNDCLHDRVLAKLSEPQSRLFIPLLQERGERPLSNEELAERSGYTVSGHFNNLRGSLRSLLLVEYVTGGTVASSWLFPLG